MILQTVSEDPAAKIGAGGASTLLSQHDTYDRGRMTNVDGRERQ